MNFDPLELNRRLERAYEVWAAWRKRLRGEPEADDRPLSAHRSLLGKEMFDQITATHPADPLREPLLRWVLRLAEQRINEAGLVTLAMRWQAPIEAQQAPEVSRLSLAELQARVLSDGAQRAAWLDQFVQHCAPYSEDSAELWQRRQEIASRLGLPHFDSLVSPCRSSDAASDADLDALTRIADRTLNELREHLAELRIENLAELLSAALGSDVQSTWPARLTTDTLAGFFRGSDLLRGLSPDLGALPQPLGAASFLRALDQLGDAWLVAQAPRDQPFAIRRDPMGLSQRRAGALFASLPTTPSFLQRELSVSRSQLSDCRRQLAHLVAIELWARALRVVLRRAALEGKERLRETFRDRIGNSLGCSVPTHAAGALFRLHVDDEHRLCGLLLATVQAQELTEAHDDDWYRNPRAIEQLRAEAIMPPTTTAEPATLEASLDATLRALRQAL